MEHKIFLASVIILAFVLGILLLVGNNTVSLLTPKGTVSQQEKEVILFSVSLMLAILIPILGFAVFVSYKYREGNEKNAKYQPEWDRNPFWQFFRFFVPSAVVLILAVIAWRSSHALDPFKSLASESEPMPIQVVALEWKWLFIYPEENIATVNFVEFPKDRPIDFQLTSDAPMNSFWIPQLGGQMYAMAGMVTHLNLMASETGEYSGTAAEINGKGFAGMKFTAKAVSDDEFRSFVENTHLDKTPLNFSEYNELAIPSEYEKSRSYSSVDPKLFQSIVQKFNPYHTH